MQVSKYFWNSCNFSAYPQARSSAPCILLLEEIDLVCKKRKEAQRDMEARMTSQVLSSLEELEALPAEDPSGRVFVMGTTSRLEVIEERLRTPDRLGVDVALGIPDTNARRQILEKMCRGLKLDPATVNLDTLAKHTPGFVGSDIYALISAAVDEAEHRYEPDLDYSLRLFN